MENSYQSLTPRRKKFWRKVLGEGMWGGIERAAGAERTFRERDRISARIEARYDKMAERYDVMASY